MRQTRDFTGDALQEPSAHSAFLFAARGDLLSLRGELPNNDPRIERIEQALAACERLTAGRTLCSSETSPSNAVDHRAEFEAALEARDEAGYLGTTPAETIRALADELRAVKQLGFPPDLTVRRVGDHTELTFCDGKYTFVLAEDTDYLIEIRRYGKAWSANIVGPGQIVFGRAIGSLAAMLCDIHARCAVAHR
ncbi:hypothetical protein AX777_17800 [Sphingobium yanoikuyae]|uniref:Uncharacterized protein n=1 Tax=Sphingobium yanoikuyae TaxID=13690 RepID=A0A177JW27_SPHYA|nr:hypothetical protein [Sphingobium yanoikuyae]OAH45459.1 hypothetical protein AX777_17800 [Sphingobium yanoikuyae]